MTCLLGYGKSFSEVEVKKLKKLTKVLLNAKLNPKIRLRYVLSVRQHLTKIVKYDVQPLD